MHFFNQQRQKTERCSRHFATMNDCKSYKGYGWKKSHSYTVPNSDTD